jgi:hypothetical protein
MFNIWTYATSSSARSREKPLGVLFDLSGSRLPLQPLEAAMQKPVTKIDQPTHLPRQCSSLLNDGLVIRCPRYTIALIGQECFLLVQPLSGNLKELLDFSGEGMIYGHCYSTQGIEKAYR